MLVVWIPFVLVLRGPGSHLCSSGRVEWGWCCPEIGEPTDEFRRGGGQVHVWRQISWKSAWQRHMRGTVGPCRASAHRSVHLFQIINSRQNPQVWLPFRRAEYYTREWWGGGFETMHQIQAVFQQNCIYWYNLATQSEVVNTKTSALLIVKLEARLPPHPLPRISPRINAVLHTVP